VDGEMVLGTSKIVLKILRLDPRGFVAQVVSGLVHVGTHYQVTIHLPDSRVPMQVTGQAFKTNDGLNPKTHKVERFTEVLFIKLPDTDRLRIKSFIAAAEPKT
jgi:hypothetical protein